MITEINVENATFSILMEIDGKIYLIAMEKEKRDAISMLVKAATKTAFPTTKTQIMLNDFLGVKK